MVVMLLFPYTQIADVQTMSKLSLVVGRPLLIARDRLFNSNCHGCLYIFHRVLDLLRETLVHGTNPEHRRAVRFLVVFRETRKRGAKQFSDLEYMLDRP
jgi:hypothetical protein